MKGNLFFPWPWKMKMDASTKANLPDPRAFRLVPQTDPTKILYRWEVAGQLRIEREYVREANSTYVILHETRITNLGKTDRF